VDRRHAWLFRVTDDETEIVTAPAAAGERGTRFGGWHGREDYGAQQRAAQLARHHYRDTAAMLAKAVAEGEQEPLVIGGHVDSIHQLLGSLPPGAQECFAGSFAVDASTLTPGRVRELAAPLAVRWAERRAERLAEQVLTMPPGGLAATGLHPCVAAVNASAVHTLVVPDDGLIPGCECGRCGALSVAAGRCRDCGTALLPVPDLIEEMVARTLEAGGEVYPVHGGQAQIAARLRFPVAR
jgi:hypothetical protein